MRPAGLFLAGARYVVSMHNPRPMRALPLLAVALGVIGTSPAGAQSAGDDAAYFAIVSAPQGAVPPILSEPMLDRVMRSMDVALRYGHVALDGGSLNSYDVRLGFPLGAKAMFGVNAGYQDLSCRGRCDGHVIAGANIEGRLTSMLVGRGADAAKLTIGLNGEAGLGRRTDITVVGFTAGLPIALLAGTPTLRIAPFLTPAIGLGHVTNDGDGETGTRFLLGGGVTFESLTSGIGANVGFQKVFLDQGKTMFGVSLVLRPR